MKPINTFTFALIFALSIGLSVAYSDLKKVKKDLLETRNKILPPLTYGYEKGDIFRYPHYPYDPPFPEEGSLWYNSSEKTVKTCYKEKVTIIADYNKKIYDDLFNKYNNKNSMPDSISYDSREELKTPDTEYSYYFAADDKEKDITIRLPANFQLKASFLPASKKWIEPTK